MADQFLEDLPEAISVQLTDLFYLVNDPNGAGTDFKLTWANLVAQMGLDLEYALHNLGDHGDVNISTPVDGQYLHYDATSGEWINQAVDWGELTGVPVTFPPETHTHDEHTGRDSATAHPAFAGALSTGFVPDPLVDGQFLFLRDDGTWAAPPTSPVGGLALNMKWDTDITATDPGSGRVKVNNADVTLATELYGSQTTDPGNDAYVVWKNINPGDFIGIWETSGDRETVYYEVTGIVTDNTGWWTVPVSYIGGVGQPENNSAVQFFVVESPDRYIPDGGDIEQVMAKVTAVDYDLDWAYRVTFKTPYSIGGTYYAQNMVFDDGWTMVANKTTTDRAAPQPSGPTESIMDDTMVWDTPYPDFTGVVHSGFEIVFTQPGYYEGMRVWAPELTADTNYRVTILELDPADDSILEAASISDPLLTEDGWATISVNSTLIGSGQKFRFILDALNSGSDSTVTGGWARGPDNNDPTADPGTGQWGRNTQSTQVRIHDTDADTVNRSTELAGVTVGSIIQIVNTLDSTQSVTFDVLAPPVDQTTHFSYGVTLASVGPGGEPPVAAVCTITITIPVAQATKYVKADTWHSLNPFPYGTVNGYLAFDGVPQAGVTDTGYGIDLFFTPYSLSPDWDVAAISSGGGSGGGGGGGLEPHVLDYHTDVTAPAPLEDDILQYKSGQWVNTPVGSGTPHAIDSHTDVSGPPTADGQVLRWNGAADWVPTALLEGDIGDWGGPYVQISGDTMTGKLIIQNDAAQEQLQIGRKNTTVLRIETAVNHWHFPRMDGNDDATFRYFNGSAYQDLFEFDTAGRFSALAGDIRTIALSGGIYVDGGGGISASSAAAAVPTILPSYTEQTTGLRPAGANEFYIVAGGSDIAWVPSFAFWMADGKALRYSQAYGRVRQVSSTASFAPNAGLSNLVHLNVSTTTVTFGLPLNMSAGGQNWIYAYNPSTTTTRTLNFASGYLSNNGGVPDPLALAPETAAIINIMRISVSEYVITIDQGYPYAVSGP